MAQPDSPVLVFALALACAAMSYGCHKLLRAVEANRIMPLGTELKGDKGIGFFGSAWPFADRHQTQFFRRSILHLLLLAWKWTLAVAAVLLGLYPVIYFVKFAGR